MEENVEIVTTKTHTTKNGYTFMRVDFNNPVSIRNYGEDIESEISKIFLETQDILPDETELNIDEKSIAEIANFGDNLEKVDKSDEKVNLIVKAFKKILEKMGVKEQEESEIPNSYKAQFSKYLDTLNGICDAVESQMKSGEQEFNLKRELVSRLTPLIESLDEVVRIGRQDRDEFEKQVSQIEYDEEDLMAQMKIQSAPQILALFDAKLNKLQKDVITYKNQIYAYYMQAIQDQMIIESQKEFLSSKTTLMAQGSLKVTNKVQGKRIQNMQSLNQSLNDMITGNAVQLEKNAKAITELRATQGISVETIKALDSSLKAGLKVFKESRTQKKDHLLRERNFLNELNEHAESYKNEMLAIGDGRTTEEKPATLNLTQDSKNE